MPRNKYTTKTVDQPAIVVHKAMANHERQLLEKEEQKERLRHVLESRKAKAANDQEKVQSAATNDNVSDMSNDAKEAK